MTDKNTNYKCSICCPFTLDDGSYTGGYDKNRSITQTGDGSTDLLDYQSTPLQDMDAPVFSGSHQCSDIGTESIAIKLYFHLLPLQWQELCRQFSRSYKSLRLVCKLPHLQKSYVLFLCIPKWCGTQISNLGFCIWQVFMQTTQSLRQVL